MTQRPPTGETAADRPRQRGGAAAFRRLCQAVSDLLPQRLSRIVTGQLIGYAVVNAATFLLDLGLLTAMRDGLSWPIPVAVTLGYATALGTNFLLQRKLNFPDQHHHVGGQLVRYVITVGLNYLIMILGLVTGLAALGVPYQVARIVAAVGEAVFLYCALRWFVFTDRPDAGSRTVTR